jgi:hypothetical protein
LRRFAGAPAALDLPFEAQTFLRPRFGVAGVLLIVLPRLFLAQFDFFGNAGSVAFGSALGKLRVGVDGARHDPSGDANAG